MSNIDELISRAEEKVSKGLGGHMIIYRFPGGWKIYCKSPFGGMKEKRELVLLKGFDTLRLALENFLGDAE